MECNLGQGDLLRLEGKPKGVVLHCLKGTVWLTRGDGMDYLISEGRSFEMKAGTTAVVEALGSAEIRLQAVTSIGANLKPMLSQFAFRTA